HLAVIEAVDGARAEQVERERLERERVLSAERERLAARGQPDEEGAGLQARNGTDAAKGQVPAPLTGVDRFGGGATGSPPVPRWPAIHAESTTWSVARVTGQHTTGDAAAAVPAAAVPAAAVPAAASEPSFEDDLDEVEAAEAPRPRLYSWLHWVALVAVAFVLGALIFLLIQNDRDAAAADGGAAAPVATAPSSPGAT
ncbi:MAG TPA: hypothetical protein PKB06_03060, partial [Actinotalea sp.]|nr:hypothetical protein [Actinotalea sp.]